MGQRAVNWRPSTNGLHGWDARRQAGSSPRAQDLGGRAYLLYLYVYIDLDEQIFGRGVMCGIWGGLWALRLHRRLTTRTRRAWGRRGPPCLVRAPRGDSAGGQEAYWSPHQAAMPRPGNSAEIMK